MSDVADSHSNADVLDSADDKSVRYVAEENIQEVHEKPAEEILNIAGRYFKRWDSQVGRFVSNIKDEYPDD
jgi:F-box protein 21